MKQDMACDYKHDMEDHGACPLVVNIDRLTQRNTNYRTTLWTGKHLQVTLMCIPVGGDIGLEVHPDVDQCICIESGCALVVMGSCKEDLSYRKQAGCHYAAVIPAGTWHNICNTGQTPLKLYSIYAPADHPFGTVERTKDDAQKAEAMRR